jgi:hypothetical protein
MPPTQEQSEVQRILESSQFRRAPKLQRFLELICQYHFQHRGHEITESVIATEAFGRGADFNPSEDSLVRVQAREVRRRLREYYESGGKGSRLRLEIPVGGYVPVFNAADSPDARRSIPALKPLWVIVALVVFAIAIVAIPLRQRAPNVEASTQRSLSPQLSLFWDRFLRSEVPTVLVLSNPAVGICPPYSSGGAASGTQSRLDREGSAACPDEFTGMGEALALHLITGIFESAQVKLLVKQSRMVNEDDITRYNLILLGGKQVNSWTRRLGSDLEIKSDHDEANPFETVFDRGTGQLLKDRALIALRRHPGTGHWLLFLWGKHSQGTHAAAQALTDERFLSQLAWPGSAKPFPEAFRLLLSVQVNDGIAEAPAPVRLRVP